MREQGITRQQDRVRQPGDDVPTVPNLQIIDIDVQLAAADEAGAGGCPGGGYNPYDNAPVRRMK